MSRIIISLDNIETKEAMSLIKLTQGLVWGYKIRTVMFKESINIIKEIKQYGNVMLDLKFFDIPSAIDEVVELFVENNVDILTIHMAAEYKPKDKYTKHCAGVTLLTSNKEIASKQNTLSYLLNYLIDKAEEFNYGYIVCPSTYANKVTKCKVISPGIRLDKGTDDHANIQTPEIAIQNGSYYLVIGRPILNAIDKIKIINNINHRVSKVL